MSIFDFLRRPATPPAVQVEPEPTAGHEAALPSTAATVVPGLTVEMKLRGRHQDGGPDDLQTAENRLAELQTRYRLGQFSGRLEEMLEDIAHAEKTVQRLRAA